MKKGLLAMVLLGCAFTAQAQHVNGGFDETWVSCVPWTSSNNIKAQGTQPDGWRISNVIGIKGLGATTVGEPVEGYAGTNYAVKLCNASNPIASSQIVPAYITLGTTWSTAKGLAANNKDGGTFGGVRDFFYKPDALRLFYKRSHGTDKPEEKASVIAYLWTGQYTQNNVPGDISIGTPTSVTMEDRDRLILNKSLDECQGEVVTISPGAACVASLEYYIEGNAKDWTECVVPFEYDATLGADAKPEKLNIILAANDYFAGSSAVGKDNTLIVDEVSLLYYSQLESLSYNGTSVAGFDKNTYEYNVDEPYDAAKLQAVADGKGATVTTNYDAATGKCVVRVEGNDISANAANYHEYTVQFVVVTDFTNPLTVSINGETTAPQTTTIQLIKEVDGSYSFALNNFRLISGESVNPVGNIKLTNLDVDGDTYTANQAIVIENGTLDDVDFWLGPALGDVPVVLTAVRDGDNMTADIDIDMTNVLGQSIKVVFAPEVTLSDGEAPAFTGLKNVTLIRTFTTGWNTICLPFDYSVNAFGEGAKAQAFASAKAAGLSFEKVEEMQANVPYLLYVPQNITEPIYFGKQVVAAVPLPVTRGDFTFVGTYESMSMADKYGVANVDGADRIRLGGASATIKGTRAYFTTTATGIKEMALLLDGTATAISRTEAATEAGFDVYTLTGIQVRKGAASLDGLKAGIYIVNGKKMIIK